MTAPSPLRITAATPISPSSTLRITEARPRPWRFQRATRRLTRFPAAARAVRGWINAEYPDLQDPPATLALLNGCLVLGSVVTRRQQSMGSPTITPLRSQAYRR